MSLLSKVGIRLAVAATAVGSVALGVSALVTSDQLREPTEPQPVVSAEGIVPPVEVPTIEPSGDGTVPPDESRDVREPKDRRSPRGPSGGGGDGGGGIVLTVSAFDGGAQRHSSGGGGGDGGNDRGPREKHNNGNAWAYGHGGGYPGNSGGDHGNSANAHDAHGGNGNGAGHGNKH